MKRTTLTALAGLLLRFGVSPSHPAEPGPGDPLSFWDSQKRGANLFSQVETRARLRVAREAGLAWVRLVPDKWKGARRDFLIGDARSAEESTDREGE